MQSIQELIEAQEIKIESSDNSETSPVSDTTKETIAQESETYTNGNVLDLLKRSLNIHWQQTTVLSAQAVHLERWGYKKLAEMIKADAEEEYKHSIVNLERLEFFDTDYQPLIVAPPSWNRHDIVAMIKYNLSSVREASSVERATIVAARSVGDELTANVMIPLLQGSEKGIELYEGYLKLIEQMGLDNFLSLQA